MGFRLKKMKAFLAPCREGGWGWGVRQALVLRLCLTQLSNYHISWASTVWEGVDRETEMGGVPVPIEVIPNLCICAPIPLPGAGILWIGGIQRPFPTNTLAVRKNGCCGNVTLLSLVLFLLHNRFLCCWAGFRAQGGGLGCGVWGVGCAHFKPKTSFP